MNDAFDKIYGSELLKRPKWVVVLFLFMIAIGFTLAKGGFQIAVGIMMLPAISIFLYKVFNDPKNGLITVYILNFLVVGLSRYIKDVPVGLAIDGMLILIYLALFFSNFFKKIPWSNAKNDLVMLAAIWYGYSLFQLVNPEAVSRIAWFYAMRGVSFYMLLLVPLVFILFNKNKDLDTFLKIWAFLSILATLKGLMQKFIGVDPFEQAWLDKGNYETHILFGKLRVFSFYSDAGQYGAAQGQAGVVFSILGLNEKKSKKLKIFYFSAGLLGFYGMMISGTRGAMSVPIMGIAMYSMLRKNTKVMIMGAILGISIVVFFKYTTIANGNATVRRMRTAFDPNDPSLQVRLANQRKLKSYMAARPFGGGIGSAGNWGLRFTPNTFLANTPTDSWYVMIWAEQGVIGLTLHLFILFYILIKSGYAIMFRIKDEEIKIKLTALASGYFGIMVASYGNGVLGQLPTGLVIYTSMAYMFLWKQLEKDKLVNAEVICLSENGSDKNKIKIER